MAKELEQHECPQCHKIFWTKYSYKKFCSTQCCSRYAYEHNKWQRSINWPKTRKCEFCGKEFSVKVANHKFCSEKCCTDYHHGKKSPQEKIPKRKCLNCGKEFFSFSEKQKYCCDKCGKEYRKKLEQPKEKKKTLDEWAREARECNLDYGNYRALIEMGKTYEELKATADNRLMIGHARRHNRIG